MNKTHKIPLKKVDKILNKIPISVNLIDVVINMCLFFSVINLPHDSICDEIFTSEDKFFYGAYEIRSALFTITLGMLCYRLRFCAYNWVSVISLSLQNIINLIAIFTVINYTVYQFALMNILILALTTLSIILYLINKKPLSTTSDK